MRLPQLSLIAAVLSSVALAAHALPMNSATVSFERFVVSFNKTYASPIERESRLGVFQQNLNRIATHPIGSSYSLGITAFADLTTEEFKRTLLQTLSPPSSTSSSSSSPLPSRSHSALPSSVDYRTSGCIGPVKNQGIRGQGVKKGEFEPLFFLLL